MAYVQEQAKGTLEINKHDSVLCAEKSMLTKTHDPVLLLLDQALEKTCLFKYTETNGLGITHILLEMFRLRREMEFMDEN